MTQLGFTPGTKVKGIVTDINITGSPPTVTINIGGDTSTAISDIRLLNNYAPQVGHTVLIEKQGAQLVVSGHIADQSGFAVDQGAGGWIKADLAAGSHDGNLNGDVYFRRILDHGSWKMQWRGGWNVSGTTMISALDEEFRPSSRRTVLVARTAVGGSNDVKLDFETNGSVLLVGATTTASSATVSGDIHQKIGHSHFIDVFVDGTHDHGASAGTADAHDHGFSGGSHSHTVSSPSWISLNGGVEYFL